jgi:ATP-dependent Clp protease ATP-binding subunit ClpA
MVVTMLDGSPMFERFTSQARHVVVLAHEEAQRLQHNYIGTEHVLLGLLGEPGGLACQALERFGMSLDSARDEVKAIVGTGKGTGSGHIPFTPRAKKILELALREASQLQHHYIGTEHILLGLVREGVSTREGVNTREGVSTGSGTGAQVLRQHSADLMPIRMAVLDLVSAAPAVAGRGRRWLRRRSAGGPGEAVELAEPELRITPAADTSLSEAARLAGSEPVGSHHLLLAALGDPDTAAARALAALGVDLDQAREALRNADVTGTSDEQPEEAGRRQMLIRVTEKQLTIEATDQVIVDLGRAALHALGDEADPPGTIRGDLPVSASLSNVWQALHDSLGVIQRRATPPPDSPGKPDHPRTEAA